MTDFATSVQSAIARAQKSIMESVAKDGLRALESVLSKSGLKDSPYMKGYELYAFATSSGVDFEIHLSAEALDDPGVADPPPEEGSASESEKAALREAAEMFTLSPDLRPVRVAKMRDVRSPARDARTRKSGVVRAPAAIRPTADGKIAVDKVRTAKSTPDGGTALPQGSFQGLMGDFIDELREVISDKLSDALVKALRKYS